VDSRQAAPVYLQAVPAGRGDGGASADGIKPPHRQDPPRPLTTAAAHRERQTGLVQGLRRRRELARIRRIMEILEEL
jgi:hypothetical protein